MLEPILSGIAFGLILAAMVGPVFFALIQTALHESFRAAAILAAGVLLSDACWIAMTYFFASQIDLTGEYRVYTGWIGGTLLVAFGLSMLFTKIKVKTVDDDKSTVHTRFAFRGFMLNSFNPAVPVFWLGVTGLLKLKVHYTGFHEGLFLFSLLATVYSTDLVKAYIANILKKWLKPSILLWINRAAGIILIAIGIQMIVKLYETG